MWPTIKFLGTIFICFFAMIGALGAKNPFPLFAVAWGVWIIYLFSLRAKREKELDRERLIRDILEKLEK
jgi:quinol-cytochrome oxidoreductase complex cytochrome b subunit